MTQIPLEITGETQKNQFIDSIKVETSEKKKINQNQILLV